MSVQAVRKISLVVLRSDCENVMASLQNAGVLHLETDPRGFGDDLLFERIADCDKKLEQLERAQTFLKRFLAAPKSIPAKNISAESLLERTCTIADKCDSSEQRINEIKNLIETFGAFGEFKEDHRELARAGLKLKLARLDDKELAKLDPYHKYEIIGKSGHHHLVAFLLSNDEHLDIDSLDPPDRSMPQLRVELSLLETKLLELKEEASRLAYQVRKLEDSHKNIAELRDRMRELTKTFGDGDLVGIHGFVLQCEVYQLKQALAGHVVALTIEEPTDDDCVPVKLKNPKMVSGFESIVKAFSGVSYFEKDKTLVVSVLFMTFGALCLLDAGYGFVLLVSGYLLAIKKNRDFGQVFMLTGAASTILGLMCGQVFGLTFAKDILLNIPPLFSLATDPMVCFKFSLLVGVLAMGLSNIVAMFQNGWATHATGCLLAILGGVTLMVEKGGMMVGRFYDPGQIFKIAAFAFFGLAISSWLIFPDPVFGKDKRLANVLWMLYSGPLGLVQDILSHMRLFGIALSGSILALVINRISGILPAPIGLFFAPLGHFTIFLLSLLSLYIHTNRLIFLEFGTKCMTGGHTYFKPFARRM